MKNGEYILVKAPDNFPGKRYRDKYCYEHVLVFWQTYGILPKSNEVIHHKDGNKYNNDISNLELKTRSMHSTEHNILRKKTYVELICPGCGNSFIREKNQTYLIKGTQYTCCSRKCIGKFTNLNSFEQQIRLNNIFVKEFKM